MTFLAPLCQVSAELFKCRLSTDDVTSSVSTLRPQGSHHVWKTGKIGKWKVLGKSQGIWFWSKCQGNVREFYFRLYYLLQKPTISWNNPEKRCHTPACTEMFGGYYIWRFFKYDNLANNKFGAFLTLEYLRTEPYVFILATINFSKFCKFANFSK